MANKPLESQQYFADNIPVPVPIPSLNSWDDQILSLTKMAILHDFNFLFLLKRNLMMILSPYSNKIYFYTI